MPDTFDYAAERPTTKPGRPLLTWLACALCIGMTAAYHAGFAGRGGQVGQIGALGYLPVQDVWSGGWFALFTSVFVHGSPNVIWMTFVHLGFNVLWLYLLGAFIEDVVHPLVWVAFFVTASVFSSACEIALTAEAPHGVSGVVYAMFGLIWAGRRSHKDWALVATPRNLEVFLGWGIFCVVATQMNWLKVANAAHFGGFLFGVVAGRFFIQRHKRFTSGLVILGLAATTVCSVAWMPWSIRWTAWKADSLTREGRYDSALYWYHRSMFLGNDPRAVWSRIFQLNLLRNDAIGAREAQLKLQEMQRAWMLNNQPQPPPSPNR